MDEGGGMDESAWQDYLARQRGHELANLRYHWGDAYEITWADGQFHAKRRDNGAMVHALHAEELRKAMSADYSIKPVPRHIRVAAEDAD